ncbi:MAG: metallophosphoesterase family protein [Deltaproteobacteria bacterium]|nr:metallophosphoesterase family protein [Deltaproteobacteria bacterium]
MSALKRWGESHRSEWVKYNNAYAGKGCVSPTKQQRKTQQVIGVISDTHGLVRPEALQCLQRVEFIIHAGDVGKPAVIQSLLSIAPVVAVRGNNDKGEWARKLPLTEVVQAGSSRIYIIHDLKELDFNPRDAGFQVVISGHSHRPSAVQRNGVLFLNPGSAGPRRFKLPITVARLHLKGPSAEAEIVKLDGPSVLG